MLWHSIWYFILHLFWHTFCYLFWHSIWHLFRHSFWRSICYLFWQSGILYHSILHLFWHSLWHEFGSRRTHSIRIWRYGARVQAWPTKSRAWDDKADIRRSRNRRQTKRRRGGRRRRKKRKQRRKNKKWGVAALLKSRDPHLAGGEK